MASIFGNIARTGRTLRLEELQRALGMNRGTLQPWDLPEYRPMVEESRAQTDRTLSSLPGLMQRTGVTGPAAGLTMERVAGAGDNNLLNLINQMRMGTRQQGLGLAQNEEDNWNRWMQLQLMAKQQRENESMNKWRKLTDMIGFGIQGGKMGAMAAMGGFGGGSQFNPYSINNY